MTPAPSSFIYVFTCQEATSEPRRGASGCKLLPNPSSKHVLYGHNPEPCRDSKHPRSPVGQWGDQGRRKKRSHEQHSAGADKRSEPGERVAPSETLRGTLKVVPRPNSQQNRPDPDSRQPPTPSPPLSASWIERGEQQRPCVTRLPLSTCLAASVHGEVSQRRDRSHRAPRSAIPFHEDNLCRLQEPRWKLEKQQEKREKSAKSPTAS